MSQDSKTGKKKALIISVSNYDNKNIHQLDFCKNNGERMYHLLKTLGYEIPESDKIVGEVQWQTMGDTLSDFFTLGIRRQYRFYFKS